MSDGPIIISILILTRNSTSLMTLVEHISYKHDDSVNGIVPIVLLSLLPQ